MKTWHDALKYFREENKNSQPSKKKNLITMLQVTKPWLNTKNCDHTVCNLLNMCSLNKCTVRFVPSKEFLSVCTRSLVHVLCDVLIFFHFVPFVCVPHCWCIFYGMLCDRWAMLQFVFFLLFESIFWSPSIKATTTKLGNEFRIFNTHGVLSVLWRVCVSTSVFHDLEILSFK